MKKRNIFIFLILILAVIIIAYFGAGLIIYNRLTTIKMEETVTLSDTPANFKVREKNWESFDTTSYRISHYEVVRFPARHSKNIILASWYIERSPSAPTVIMVHGINVCKDDYTVLMPAAMLYKAGFNVLLFDLRNHGFSDKDNGRTSVGNKEYLDVLGAWDWLVNQKKIVPERIGLFGVSLGAGTSLIAFTQEKRIAAVFVDSPYSNLLQIIQEELKREHYPPILAYGAIVMARLTTGDNLIAYNPSDAICRHSNRPIFIVHGTADKRINIHHTRDLAALAKKTGANVTVWFAPDAEHAQTVLKYPKEYEQRLVNFFRKNLSFDMPGTSKLYFHQNHGKILKVYGKAYLEKISELKIIHTFGSPYEEGYQHGILLKDDIKNCFKEVYEDGFFKACSAFPKKLWYFYAKLNEKFLTDTEKQELAGISDAAGLKYEDILVMNSEAPYLVANNLLKSTKLASFCDQLAVQGKATANGSLLVGRNLDTLDLDRWHKYANIQVHHPDKGYSFITPGYAGKTLDASAGWNEYDFCVSQNNVCAKHLNPYGIYTGILMRRLVQFCKNTEEAENLIKKLHPICNAGTSILIDDVNSTKVIEVIQTIASGKIIGVRRMGQYKDMPETISLSNHYETSETDKLSIPPDLSSLSRNKRLKNLIKENYGKIDVEIIKKILTDKMDINSGRNIGSEFPSDNAIDWYGEEIKNFGPFKIPNTIEVRITTVMSCIRDLKNKTLWLAQGKKYIDKPADFIPLNIKELLNL